MKCSPPRKYGFFVGFETPILLSMIRVLLASGQAFVFSRLLNYSHSLAGIKLLKCAPTEPSVPLRYAGKKSIYFIAPLDSYGFRFIDRKSALFRAIKAHSREQT